MFRVVDKLLLLMVGFPPLYFVFRFLRWYVNTDLVAPEQSEYQGKSAQNSASDSGSHPEGHDGEED